jgi:hypothetical protein
MAESRSEKHELARSCLPEELRHVFDDFVNDYKFAATKIHGSPFVSYMVLADMVRAGWSPEWQGDQAKQHGPNCHPLC